jgi:DNA-binding response OmpR family regulator
MSKRVLSVNENKPMNYLLQTVLFHKYWLICVNDVFSGMHEIRNSKRIDLIIVDLDYQKKENLDFIEHIKTSYLYNVPMVILVSETNKAAIETLSLTITIDKYFIKPFNPIDLCHTIDQLLLPEFIENA